jgi:hypothetical protein
MGQAKRRGRKSAKALRRQAERPSSKATLKSQARAAARRHGASPKEASKKIARAA